MKGMIFNSLAELVETQYGIETLNKVISSIDSVVDGAYVGTESYPASEATDFVAALSEFTGSTPSALLDAFGQKLFGDLYALYPELVDQHTALFPFLDSVGSHIHEQMKIIYVDAEVPSLTSGHHQPREMTFYYDSPRQLCLLAEGLVRGAAHHFGSEIEIEQPTCMHEGAERCQFIVRLLN